MRQGIRRTVRSAHGKTRFSVAALASLCLSAGCALQGGTEIRATSVPDAGWPMYNGGYSAERFSPLQQINTRNVGSLQQVGRYQLPAAGRFVNGPVVIGDTMYITSAGDTFAIDARTGALRWSHHYPITSLGNGVSVRGIAYADGRLFRGASDAHLIALDARTGRMVWDVAAADPEAGEYFTMAPIVWRKRVFIGNAGGDIGAVGHVRAFDTDTGRRLWNFDVIPSVGPAAATWPKDPGRRRAGGGMYSSLALDEATGIFYVPTGNPGPDFAGAYRPGDNLYSCSVVMLDAATGALRGYHQFTRNDVHDWDIAASPVLFTSKAGRPMVAVGSKDGNLYGLSRDLASVAFQTGVTRIENGDAPITASGTHFRPGTNGGVNSNGPAYDPPLNALIVNATDSGSTIRLAAPDTLRPEPRKPFLGSSNLFGDDDAETVGWTTAVDADSGRVLWRRQAPTPMTAAVTPTAGGVVFTADAQGKFLALDAATGTVLLEKNLGHPIGGGVITYAIGGTQYVAVAADMNNPTVQTRSAPGFVAIFALPAQ